MNLKRIVLSLTPDEVIRLTKILLDEEKKMLSLLSKRSSNHSWIRPPEASETHSLQSFVEAKGRIFGKPMKNWMIFFFVFFLSIFNIPISNAQQPSQIQIYIFYAEDCPSCQAIIQSYVPNLKSMYPFLEVKTFDLANPAYYEALTMLEQKYNRRGVELPVVFIGDQMLSGEQIAGSVE